MAIDKVAYWNELADYDIDIAEVMYNGGRWLYVGFMCHQVIEKTIKFYWSAIKPDEVPFIHKLLEIGTKLWVDNQDVTRPTEIYCRVDANDHRGKIPFLQRRTVQETDS